MPAFNWVFEYQPIASDILIKPSRYKSESILLADEKGPNHWNQIVVWVIYLSNMRGLNVS